MPRSTCYGGADSWRGDGREGGQFVTIKSVRGIGHRLCSHPASCYRLSFARAAWASAMYSDQVFVFAFGGGLLFLIDVFLALALDPAESVPD